MRRFGAFSDIIGASLSESHYYHVYGGGGGGKYCCGWTTKTNDNVSSACNDVNQDQQPPLLAMNGRGYTVLHVHNESSASGQAPEEEGPGSC